MLITRLAETIDTLTEFVGKVTSWLVLLLVILVGYDVFMRYVFNSGSIAIQELEWHLFSIIFLAGAAYTLKHNEHVRLDIIYQSRFVSERQRAWIDFLGALFILLPFCLLVIVSAWPFVNQAYISNESSPDPGGLPMRWLIKGMIPVGFGLLFLQGLAEVIKKAVIALGVKQ